ncbi:MAG: hypothetical protein RDU83_13930 [bacterium]|nr:hypothetical protein [bacterium]
MIRFVVLLTTSVLLVAACGTLGTVQLPTIVGQHFDGAGDAIGPAIVRDVLRIETRRIDNPPYGSYDTLEAEIVFTAVVTLPPPGSGPDVGGAQLAFNVGFDTDKNPATGGAMDCGAQGSTPGLDFLVLGQGGGAPADRLVNGNYNVINASWVVTGEATVSVYGSTLTVTTPLSAMGSDDGATHLMVFAGNRNGGWVNVNDCAPNPAGGIITRTGVSHGFRQ